MKTSREKHMCNFRCDQDTHYDVAYSKSKSHLTKEEIKLYCEIARRDTHVIDSMELLEYTIDGGYWNNGVSFHDIPPSRAYGVIFKYKPSCPNSD